MIFVAILLSGNVIEGGLRIINLLIKVWNFGSPCSLMVSVFEGDFRRSNLLISLKVWNFVSLCSLIASVFEGDFSKRNRLMMELKINTTMRKTWNKCQVHPIKIKWISKQFFPNNFSSTFIHVLQSVSEWVGVKKKLSAFTLG